MCVNCHSDIWAERSRCSIWPTLVFVRRPESGARRGSRPEFREILFPPSPVFWCLSRAEPDPGDTPSGSTGPRPSRRKMKVFNFPPLRKQSDCRPNIKTVASRRRPRNFVVFLGGSGQSVRKCIIYKSNTGSGFVFRLTRGGAAPLRLALLPLPDIPRLIRSH